MNSKHTAGIYQQDYIPVFICTHNTSLRIAKKIWERFGGVIQPVLGTGDVFFRHPAFGKPLRVNNRRKDSPAKLISLINQLTHSSIGNI